MSGTLTPAFVDNAWQLQPSWRIVWPSSVPPAFAECLPLHPSNPSVGLAEGCQTPQPDGLQNDVRNLCHSQQGTHPCEELRINFTVGRGGRKLFLTDQEPHHGVPCANTSETPSVPTQIVQQLRLAGLPDSTLPWELVVSALDQKVLSTWPMCVKRPSNACLAADNSPTCTRDMARAALLASSSSSCARRLWWTDCV